MSGKIIQAGAGVNRDVGKRTVAAEQFFGVARAIAPNILTERTTAFFAMINRGTMRHKLRACRLPWNLTYM
jgi:hypothetical protein